MTNPDPSGGGPIRLGALAPLSRPGFLEAGRHLCAGVELAVEEINEAGGIAGRPLELEIRDTAGSPRQAAAAVEAFAAEGALAVVGEYHSVVAHAAATAAVKAQLAFVCSSAVLDAVVDAPADSVARVAPAQSYCWSVYADYLASAGRRHVTLVVQYDRYWSAGAQVLRAELAGRGVAVTQIDHAALLDGPALSTDALLLLVGFPEPAVSIVKAVRAEPTLNGIEIGDPAGRAEFNEWTALLGEDGTDIPYLRYLPAQLEQRGIAVAERLSRILGEAPSFVALEGHDSVHVVAEALRIAGPDRLRVIKALSSLRIDGTRGPITFARGQGPILQWAWPPVQVAARRDPRRPEEISILHQARAAG